MSGIRANAPIPGATSKPTRRFDSNREDGYYQFDDDFHGTRVRVRTVDHSYEGWARLWLSISTQSCSTTPPETMVRS
jgi:hypothetical protein